MSIPIETANVANEAVDQLQVAKEYLDWFDTLSWAISLTLKQGQTHHAQRLASVVQYLSGEYLSVLESEVSGFSDRLSSLDLRT